MMRVETTVALPQDLLTAIDECSKGFGGRSGFIEAALRAFVGRATYRVLDARDREIIDRHADELNREAEDALEFQIPL